MEAAVAWLKAIHVVTLLVWAAGLFYLPSLFAAHCRGEDRHGFYRLRAMTRVAYLGIASPAAILAIVSGSALIFASGPHDPWLALKLVVVSLMVFFHLWCGTILSALRTRPIRWRPAALHCLVIAPLLLVPAVFYLALVRPV